MKTISASKLQVGDQLPEEDGFLFTVAEIVKETGETITFRLTSDFSSHQNHWTIKKDGTPGGIIKTFSKDTELYYVPKEPDKAEKLESNKRLENNQQGLDEKDEITEEAAPSPAKEELDKMIRDLAQNYRENPEIIAELTEYASRFHSYSVQNVLRLYAQNPNLTYVASFKKWNEMGYRIKAHEHGLKIIHPVTVTLYCDPATQEWKQLKYAPKQIKSQIKKGEIKTKQFTKYVIGRVFDISQTDCPPEDYPKLYFMGYPSEKHAELCDAISKYAEMEWDCKVSIVDLQSISLRGQYYRFDNKIFLSDKLNDTERLSTLTHELGHAITWLVTDKGENYPVPLREIEADMFSIMVETHFGLPVSDSRKRHLSQEWKNYLDTMEKSGSSSEEMQLPTVEEVFSKVHDLYKSNIEAIHLYVSPDKQRAIISALETAHGDPVVELTSKEEETKLRSLHQTEQYLKSLNEAKTERTPEERIKFSLYYYLKTPQPKILTGVISLNGFSQPSILSVIRNNISLQATKQQEKDGAFEKQKTDYLSHKILPYLEQHNSLGILAEQCHGSLLESINLCRKRLNEGKPLEPVLCQIAMENTNPALDGMIQKISVQEPKMEQATKQSALELER